MSLLTYAARRTAFAAVATVLVLSVTFLVVRVAPNTNLGMYLYYLDTAGMTEAEVQAAIHEYRVQRGLTGSLFDQYVRFVLDAAVLDFGHSQSMDRPVAGVLGAAVPRTLGYVVPGVLAAYAAGILGGLASAYEGRLTDWSVRLSSYVALGVTSIALSVVLVTALRGQFPWLAPPFWGQTPFMSYGAPSLRGTDPWVHVSWRYVLPAFVLAVGLLSGLVRHTRNNALAFRGSDTAKVLEAKGASRALNARHALKNAALPLLSVSFAELMSVLALSAFVVETVFRVPGVAAFAMIGVYTRDYALVVGATFVFAVIGIAGTLCQDLLYGYLDPRIGE